MVSIVDGATSSLAEARMGVSVIEGEFVETKILELVFGETQFPGDVGPADGKGVVVFDDEGHGMVVK